MEQKQNWKVERKGGMGTGVPNKLGWSRGTSLRGNIWAETWRMWEWANGDIQEEYSRWKKVQGSWGGSMIRCARNVWGPVWLGWVRGGEGRKRWDQKGQKKTVDLCKDLASTPRERGSCWRVMSIEEPNLIYVLTRCPWLLSWGLHTESKGAEPFKPGERLW